MPTLASTRVAKHWSVRYSAGDGWGTERDGHLRVTPEHVLAFIQRMFAAVADDPVRDGRAIRGGTLTNESAERVAEPMNR
jgi:hypothetical protein